MQKWVGSVGCQFLGCRLAQGMLCVVAHLWSELTVISFFLFDAVPAILYPLFDSFC